MKALKTSPWLYRAYPSDTQSTVFGPMLDFVDIWRLKCPRAGEFPKWSDFDFMDFKGWWGQMSLAELHYDPFDLRWALWGTKITDWWGIDYTGQYISDIEQVREVWRNHERMYLERLIGERAIGFVNGTLAPQDREYLNICGIDLPLEENGVVTHILSAYQLCEPDVVYEPSEDPIFKVR